MPHLIAATDPAIEHVQNLSILWSIPFVLLLTCAATLPLISAKFWHKSYAWISVGLGAIAAAYYFFIAHDPWSWVHEMQEYVSFIALLASLYIVSGGIYISVKRKATPAANCVLLLIGAVLANVVGTTGASMLLIRPYLRMNVGHIKPFHVVFFIFLVANVGGALTPIGDPPLFLGYLYGVPFWWVVEHARDAWFLAVGVLIALFFIIDTIDHRKWARNEPEADHGGVVKVIGAANFLFIALILFAVFREGMFDIVDLMRADGFSMRLLGRFVVSREVLMLAAAVGSKWLTRDEPYNRNEFSYAAIKEVAILFIGIFSTMAPALQWLQANADRMPLKTPGQYYFTCGGLSSVLDNAPTYLTFLQTELGALDQEQIDAAANELEQMAAANTIEVRNSLRPPEVKQAVEAMVKYHPTDVKRGKLRRAQVEVAFLVGVPARNVFLVAISLGAVFFGACTYIGNGPNFMVKSIADSHGAKTPSFITYVWKYSIPILIPTYALVWWVFLKESPHL